LTLQGSTLQQSIGIETLGGVFTPLLERGCQLPCTSSQTFSTAQDDQDQITLAMYQGEAKLTRDAHSLGKFRISGLAPQAKGEPLIRVEFRADSKGVSIAAADERGTSALVLSRVAH